MCGICGVWEYGATSGNVERDTIVSMRDVMTHRGPDDQGDLIFDDGRGGLGFRRLSIIDLSPAGHQPMHGCTDRVWLVFNGEIYNHATLRESLEAMVKHLAGEVSKRNLGGAGPTLNVV